MSIFTKIKSLFIDPDERKIESVYPDDDEFVEKMNKVVKSFYIPSSSVLSKVKQKEALTEEEAEEYIRYIKSNFYLSAAHLDTLQVNFSGEWIKKYNDVQAVRNRRKAAYINIKTHLMHNSGYDILDAIWLANDLYVDSCSTNQRRIITKKLMDDHYEFEVITDIQNRFVGQQITKLKKEIIDGTKLGQTTNNLVAQNK